VPPRRSSIRASSSERPTIPALLPRRPEILPQSSLQPHPETPSILPPRQSIRTPSRVSSLVPTFLRRGVHSQGSPETAVARESQRNINHRHRAERRHGEETSQTPPLEDLQASRILPPRPTLGLNATVATVAIAPDGAGGGTPFFMCPLCQLLRPIALKDAATGNCIYCQHNEDRDEDMDEQVCAKCFQCQPRHCFISFNGVPRTWCDECHVNIYGSQYQISQDPEVAVSQFNHIMSSADDDLDPVDEDVAPILPPTMSTATVASQPPAAAFRETEPDPVFTGDLNDSALTEADRQLSPRGQRDRVLQLLSDEVI
jgi:hypothetical protein